MKQRIDTLELFTGWQVQNKWKLSDPVTGDLIAAFKEDSECCQRQCCKNARAFKAASQGNVLFKMDRPFHCQCICCADACDGFCGQELTTLTSNNLVISRAVQESDCACPCWLDWKLAIYSDRLEHIWYSDVKKVLFLEKSKPVHISRLSTCHKKSTGWFGISGKNHLNHPPGFFKNVFLNNNMFLSKKLRFFRKKSRIFGKKKFVFRMFCEFFPRG